MAKDMLVGWDIEWRREVLSLGKGDIIFGGSICDRVLWRISERRSFPHILERNANFLGVDEDEEGTIPCHGNFEGEV